MQKKLMVKFMFFFLFIVSAHDADGFVSLSTYSTKRYYEFNSWTMSGRDSSVNSNMDRWQDLAGLLYGQRSHQRFAVSFETITV